MVSKATTRGVGSEKIDLDAEHFPVPVLDHVQGAKAAAIGQRIAPIIQGPADIRLCGYFQRPFYPLGQAFLFPPLAELQVHVLKLALYVRVKGGLTGAVLPANLNHRLALVLLVQNIQNLRFVEAVLFHKQSKMEEVKSCYFSLFLTSSLLREAYRVTIACW